MPFGLGGLGGGLGSFFPIYAIFFIINLVITLFKGGLTPPTTTP